MRCKGKAKRLRCGRNETDPGERGNRRGKTEKGRSNEFVNEHG